MALAIALLLSGVLLPCWGEFALFKKGSTKVSRETFQTFRSSRGRWPGHHSPSRRGQLGLEREEGDGAGVGGKRGGDHPLLGISSQAGSLVCSERTCFTSLVALEVKESGLITSCILPLPRLAPSPSPLWDTRSCRPVTPCTPALASAPLCALLGTQLFPPFPSSSFSPPHSLSLPHPPLKCDGEYLVLPHR